MVDLAPVTPEADGFDQLLRASQTEGHRMLLRFAENWQSGGNRFDRPGECILGAWQDGTLIGVCGRNIDPYDTVPRAGRVRHLYVAPAARRTGLGRRLVDTILIDAGLHFDYLNTNAPEAAYQFYERLGFARVPGLPRVTHRLMLGDA